MSLFSNFAGQDCYQYSAGWLWQDGFITGGDAAWCYHDNQTIFVS